MNNKVHNFYFYYMDEENRALIFFSWQVCEEAEPGMRRSFPGSGPSFQSPYLWGGLYNPKNSRRMKTSRHRCKGLRICCSLQVHSFGGFTGEGVDSAEVGFCTEHNVG